MSSPSKNARSSHSRHAHFQGQPAPPKPAKSKVHDRPTHSLSQDRAEPELTTNSKNYNRTAEILQEFFNKKPSRYSAAPERPSSATRSPKFYDLHLHKDLRLKKIVVLKGLERDLAKICDDTIGSKSHPIHSMKIEDGLKIFLQEPMHNSSTMLDGEDDVVHAYHQLTPTLTTVASTLVFGTKDAEWNTVFKWSDRALEKQEHARADGFLYIGSQSDNGLKLSEDHKRDINLIKKYKFHHLAAWEFKSLAAGTSTVMEDILELEGEFEWMTCQIGEGTSGNVFRCSDSSPHTTNGLLSTTGRQTGPDALKRGYLRPAETTEESVGVSELEDNEENDDSEDGSVQFSQTTEVADTGELLPADGNNLDFINLRASASFHTFLRALDATTPTAHRKIGRKGSHIVQQLWTGAVRNDVTFIVLNSGNYEIIGIRERETGTLYLSDIIFVPYSDYPTHRKLHIALYMHAYYDALDRAEQLEHLEELEGSAPQWLRLWNIATSYQEDQGNAELLRGRADIYPLLLNELENKDNSFMIRLPRYIGSWKEFRRCYHIHTQPSEEPSRLSDWQMDAVRQISHRVYSIVMQRNERSYSDRLIIKFALNPTQQEDLIYEDSFARFFPSISVRSLGIFIFSRELPVSFMLMERAGKTLSELIKSGRRFDKEICKAKLRDALNIIHNHFILHGNIDSSHILIQEAKDRDDSKMTVCLISADDGQDWHKRAANLRILDKTKGRQNDIDANVDGQVKEEELGRMLHKFTSGRTKDQLSLTTAFAIFGY